MKYWTYILLTNKNTLYTGICTDIEKRFDEHKKGVKAGGAKYTNAFKPVKILYKCEFEGKSAAMVEEARIKKLTRAQKLELCGLDDDLCTCYKVSKEEKFDEGGEN